MDDAGKKGLSEDCRLFSISAETIADQVDHLSDTFGQLVLIPFAHGGLLRPGWTQAYQPVHALQTVPGLQPGTIMNAKDARLPL